MSSTCVPPRTPGGVTPPQWNAGGTGKNDTLLKLSLLIAVVWCEKHNCRNFFTGRKHCEIQLCPSSPSCELAQMLQLPQPKAPVNHSLLITSMWRNCTTAADSSTNRETRKPLASCSPLALFGDLQKISCTFGSHRPPKGVTHPRNALQHIRLSVPHFHSQRRRNNHVPPQPRQGHFHNSHGDNHVFEAKHEGTSAQAAEYQGNPRLEPTWLRIVN